MAQKIEIHPENPQDRLLGKVIDCLRSGGLVIYPTDSAYALGCHIGDKAAMERMRRVRGLDKHHNFTLVCRDLSELGQFAVVDNSVFRLLKANTPGAYTYILKATKEVPKRLMHPKRKTIGIRIPDSKITQALLAELDEPILSTSLLLPNQKEPFVDIQQIEEAFDNHVDMIIDGGYCGEASTTVINLLDGCPEILRVGQGDPAPFE